MNRVVKTFLYVFSFAIIFSLIGISAKADVTPLQTPNPTPALQATATDPNNLGVVTIDAGVVAGLLAVTKGTQDGTIGMTYVTFAIPTFAYKETIQVLIDGKALHTFTVDGSAGWATGTETSIPFAATGGHHQIVVNETGWATMPAGLPGAASESFDFVY
ncbi:hypothetical protein ACRYI5_03325 [Furfurilactobacillus sp. WILCCON 0119]